MGKEKQLTKVYITTYALTSGITEAEGEISDLGFFYQRKPWVSYSGTKEYYKTIGEAKIAAEQKRLKKIESVKKQLSKLEKLKF